MAVITIVTSAPPLTEGGHLVLARSLERALIDAGHRAGIVTTPSNRFGRQGPAYLANWLTDVGMTGTGERVDQVISLRFPELRRAASDSTCAGSSTRCASTTISGIEFSRGISPQGRVKETRRGGRSSARADTYFFKRHVKKLFTISQAVRDRLARWNHVDGEVLHPPPPQRAYRCDGYGDYLFFASRLSPLEARGSGPARAGASRRRAASAASSAAKAKNARGSRRLARELGLDERVTFTGQLTETALVDHLARCRAVVFVPRDEDYGFVTVEAFASAKAGHHLHGQRRSARVRARRRERPRRRPDAGVAWRPRGRGRRTIRRAGRADGRAGAGDARDVARADAGADSRRGSLSWYRR